MDQEQKPKSAAPERVANAVLFERLVTPHLEAAWNLARWMVRDINDAEDAVQEACLRGCRFIGGYQGGEFKSWFLAIVRNVCHSARQSQGRHAGVSLDESGQDLPSDVASPAEQAERSADAQALRAAIARLPMEFREALVLREFEGQSYKEIAAITEVPIGTVMSRLARARERLAAALGGKRVDEEADKEIGP
jgi:RNA polymerase sigma-70 factor (ECF subfamily)